MATSTVPAPATGPAAANGAITEARRSELSVIPEEYLPRTSDLTTRSADRPLRGVKARDPEAGSTGAPTIHQRRRDAFIPGFHDRAPFTDWLRHSWREIMTTLLCVLLSGAIYIFGRPLLPRYFPLYIGVETSEWGLKHGKPYRLEWITTTTSALVSFFVPFLVIGAIGLWGVRRFWETNAALMGLGYALATTTLLVSVIKWVFGGLRPHFLAVCTPTVTITPIPTYHPASICTGRSPYEIKEAQMSFPSGHSSAAFAGFGFLALYLNAKYKVFGHGEDGRRVSHWKLVMFVLPWLVAVLIAASKIRDGWHHPVDVVFGAFIGTVLAHLAFKMVFRSVYNLRDNHVPRE